MTGTLMLGDVASVENSSINYEGAAEKLPPVESIKERTFTDI